MSVRSRILLTLFALCIIFVFFQAIIFVSQGHTVRTMVNRNMEDLEATLTWGLAFRAQSLISFSTDYTYWDDMVSFVHTGDEEWAQQNIDTSLGTYDVDAAWVYRPDKTLVYESHGESFPVEKGVINLTEYLSALTHKKRLIHFFLSDTSGLLEIAGATIHPTSDPERLTEPQGYFLAARLWDRDFLDNLGPLVQGTLQIHGTEYDHPRSSVRNDDGMLVYHTPLCDIGGKPVAVIEASTRRPWLVTWSRTSYLQLLTGAVFSMLLLAILALAIYKWVGVPLHLVSGALAHEEPARLGQLADDSAEFGKIARLIVQFFEQNKRLVQQIEERKCAELALRASEQRAREILDSLVTGVLLYSPETLLILQVNKSLIEMTGYSREALIGRDYRELLSVVEDDKPAKAQESTAEALLTFSDGGQMPVLLFSSRVNMAEGPAVLTSLVDIRAQKIAENTLLELNRQFASILEFLPDATVVVDAERRVIAWNRTMAAMTGITAEKISGQSGYSYRRAFYEDGRPLLLDHVLDGRDPAESGYRNVRWEGATCSAETVLPAFRNGRDTEIWIAAAPFTDDAGRVLGAIECIRDVTDLRETEKRKDELEGQLFQSQKMESIGRLAGGIAHDFNNLLLPVQTYAELGLQRLSADNPVAGYLEEIRVAATRASNLTKQILAFGRRQTLDQRILNLNEILDQFERMLRRVIGEDIHFITEFDPALKTIRADRTQVEQIVLNLAVNARDAMPHGGILTLRTSNVVLDEVYVESHADVVPGEYVLLTVCDTGCGMDRKTQSQVFDPFFTTKEQGKGTGLGLATVYGIVKQHGGSIWVYSEPGSGTTFKLFFPVKMAESTASTTTEHTAEIMETGGKETILVVEDEEQVRKITSKLLSDQGYHVLVAGHPARAIEQAREYPENIDLLLTDIIMPEMNGRELYDSLSKSRPGIKVLYMSGYTGDVIGEHGILDKNANLLEKPFSIFELARRVRMILDA